MRKKVPTPDGKWLRWVNFLTTARNTCTVFNVAEVGVRDKSPPGVDTAPTMVMGPSCAVLPSQRPRPLRWQKLAKRAPEYAG